MLTAGEDGKARLWDWRRRQVRLLVGGDSPLAGAALAAPGTRVVTSGADGALREWRDLEPPRVALPGVEGDELSSLAFSRDGRLLATGGVFASPGGPARFVRVWDLARRRPLATLDEPPAPAGDSGLFHRVALSPDGRLVAAAGESGAVQVWDWQTRDLLARLPLDPVLPQATSPSSTSSASPSWPRATCACGTGGRTVRTLRPFAGGARPLHQRIAFAARAGVLFTPDGRLVATAHEGHGTQVWDRRAGRVVADLRDDLGFAADFSGDGMLLATSDRGTGARLWDWRRGEEIARLRPLRERTDDGGGWTWDVAVSPDARRVAAIDRSGTAFVYDCRVCGGTETLLAQADRRDAPADSGRAAALPGRGLGARRTCPLRPRPPRERVRLRGAVRPGHEPGQEHRPPPADQAAGGGHGAVRPARGDARRRRAPVEGRERGRHDLVG